MGRVLTDGVTAQPCTTGNDWHAGGHRSGSHSSARPPGCAIHARFVWHHVSGRL